MIERIRVKHFQAIAEADLELAPYTVIVGPSSSGKSALARAIRSLASNRRGTDFIEHGQRTASIEATTQHGTVTLTRSTTPSGANSYIVRPADPQHPLHPERVYTKLGGEVPPEVSDFLGIAAKDAINFASQFDKPYLLDESGGEAARVLGSLTNVSVIFDAAREANRRRLATSQTLRTRADDLQAVKDKVPGYRALQAQQAAIEKAEAHLDRVLDLRRRIGILEKAIGTLEAAEMAISRLEERAAVAVPTADGAVRAAERLGVYRTTLRDVQAGRTALSAAEQAMEQAQQEWDRLEAEQWEVMLGLGDVFMEHGTAEGWTRDLANDAARIVSERVFGSSPRG